MGDAMKIRRGNREDLKFLPELLMAAYSGIEEYGEESIEKARRYIDELYDEDPNCFFVAEENGDIVGFIFCNRFWYSKFEHSHVGEINEIVVVPRFHHQGVGRELIKMAMEELHTDKIELWVGRENNRAIEFYKRLGFKEKETAGEWIRMIKN